MFITPKLDLKHSKANLVVNKNNWLCKPGKFQQFFNQRISD